jgi:hypothetical protein
VTRVKTAVTGAKLVSGNLMGEVSNPFWRDFARSETGKHSRIPTKLVCNSWTFWVVSFAN